jgi:AAA domain
VQVVVIDPISAHMGDREGDSITTFRPVLSRLAEFAERSRVAVLATHHLPKTTRRCMRSPGRWAFISAPRMGFVIAKEEGSERRLLLSVGRNIGAQGDGLGFYIVEKTVFIHIEHQGVRRLTGRIVTP